MGMGETRSCGGVFGRRGKLRASGNIFLLDLLKPPPAGDIVAEVCPALDAWNSVPRYRVGLG